MRSSTVPARVAYVAFIIDAYARRIIAEQAPGSVEELSDITGRAKSNPSRPLKTMVGYGLIRMERSGRKRAPKVIHDRVALNLPLTERHAPLAMAAGGRS